MLCCGSFVAIRNPRATSAGARPDTLIRSSPAAACETSFKCVTCALMAWSRWAGRRRRRATRRTWTRSDCRTRAAPGGGSIPAPGHVAVLRPPAVEGLRLRPAAGWLRRDLLPIKGDAVKALRLLGWKSEPELVEVPDPEPGPGDVVIRVGGAGACHSDLHLMRDFDTGALPWDPPFTLGHENAGWVHLLG